jgi:glutathione S-transferase
MTFKVVNEESGIPDAMVDGKPTLVYWNIVGLALPIRLALAYACVDFVDVRIDAGDPKGDNFNKAYPPSKAGKLSKIMPFVNLPYFLDGDGVAIAQTNTILRFVARKYGLVSSQEHMTDYFCDHLADIESEMTRFMYGKSAEAVLQWYKTSAPVILAKFSEILKNGGKPFLTGVTPRIDDFRLYSVLHKLCMVQEDLGSDETKPIVTDDLLEYMKRVKEIPKIKEYLSGPDHLPKPINNPIAKWIGE